MPLGTSWHIPTISSYNVQDPMADLNVVYLQRMTEIELKQVEEALKTMDQEAVQRLNIGETPQLRPLRIKKWIRDHFPSSANTLEIAKAAHAKQYHSDKTFDSFVFVDSAWDLGNVIAAHWEPTGLDDEERLSAVRVPMGIANIVLTACDRVEGMTLSHALGQDVFEQSQVIFYKDLPEGGPSEPSELPWPSHLPRDLKLSKDNPTIVSLRHLDDATMTQLKQDIKAQDAQIYNWEGPEPKNRLVIRDIYNRIRYNTDRSEATSEPSESLQRMYAFFIDYMLQGPNGEPQILSVSRIQRDPVNGVEVLPVFTSEFVEAWGKVVVFEAPEDDAEIVEIWKREHVDHLNTANNGESASTSTHTA